MGEIKTKVSDASVTKFINAVPNERRRKDGFALLEIFTRITGEEPKMWGPSIIGFGSYHYKSERSSQEGDWPLTGFSPRKQSLTLYVIPDSENKNLNNLFDKLGKHKTSRACLYINTLGDVNLAVLKQIIKESYEDAKAQHKAH